jgi:hypothetical protein
MTMTASFASHLSLWLWSDSPPRCVSVPSVTNEAWIEWVLGFKSAQNTQWPWRTLLYFR